MPGSRLLSRSMADLGIKSSWSHDLLSNSLFCLWRFSLSERLSWFLFQINWSACCILDNFMSFFYSIPLHCHTDTVTCCSTAFVVSGSVEIPLMSCFVPHFHSPQYSGSVYKEVLFPFSLKKLHKATNTIYWIMGRVLKMFHCHFSGLCQVTYINVFSSYMTALLKKYRPLSCNAKSNILLTLSG